MKKSLLLLAVIAGVFLPSSAISDQYAVIVHPSNQNKLDKQIISKIFLGTERVFPSGEKALAFNQMINKKVTQSFNRKMLNKSGTKIKTYWAKKLFTGRGIPPKELSNQDIIFQVANTPNAIGYIEMSAVTQDVKVIAKFDDE